MAVTLDEVIKLAKQLSRKDQEQLIEQLSEVNEQANQKQEFLGLLVFDVGPWPDDVSLQREKMYGEQER